MTKAQHTPGEANINLIAPELLEALIQADNKLREFYAEREAVRGWIAPIMDITETAIKKAKGETL